MDRYERMVKRASTYREHSHGVERRAMRRVTLLLGLAMTSGAFAADPDLILFDGKVFTADVTTPHAEAIAISGDRIVDVGTSKRILASGGPTTRYIDLGGRVIVPGFNDAHYHHMPTPEGVTVKLPAAQAHRA